MSAAEPAFHRGGHWLARTSLASPPRSTWGASAMRNLRSAGIRRESGDVKVHHMEPRPKHWTKRAVRIVVGLALLVAGVAMLALPGPGWLTIAGGLTLLATEFL